MLNIYLRAFKVLVEKKYSSYSLNNIELLIDWVAMYVKFFLIATSNDSNAHHCSFIAVVLFRNGWIDANDYLPMLATQRFG